MVIIHQTPHNVPELAGVDWKSLTKLVGTKVQQCDCLISDSLRTRPVTKVARGYISL